MIYEYLFPIFGILNITHHVCDVFHALLTIFIHFTIFNRVPLTTKVHCEQTNLKLLNHERLNPMKFDSTLQNKQIQHSKRKQIFLMLNNYEKTFTFCTFFEMASCENRHVTCNGTMKKKPF